MQGKVIDKNEVHEINDFLHQEDGKMIESFEKMDSMIKKDTVTDYDAELAAYRDKKYGNQDSGE